MSYVVTDVLQREEKLTYILVVYDCMDFFKDYIRNAHIFLSCIKGCASYYQGASDDLFLLGIQRHVLVYHPFWWSGAVAKMDIRSMSKTMALLALLENVVTSVGYVVIPGYSVVNDDKFMRAIRPALTRLTSEIDKLRSNSDE